MIFRSETFNCVLVLKPLEDLTEEPEVANVLLPGGWSNVDTGALHQDVKAHFEKCAGKEKSCAFSDCKEKVVSGKKYYCKADCDGTIRHIQIEELPRLPEVEVVSVTEQPTSKCFRKLTSEFQMHLLLDSTINTEKFVESHCGFESKVADLAIAGGSFVDLPTGTQYCIMVQERAQDHEQNTTLALYQYNLDGTVPFLVAHPFDDNSAYRGMDSCVYFMLKVASLWN